MARLYFFNFDCEAVLQGKAVLTNKTPKDSWHFLIHASVLLLPLCTKEDSLIVKTKPGAFWLDYWQALLGELPYIWDSDSQAVSYTPLSILRCQKQIETKEKQYIPCLWGWVPSLIEALRYTKMLIQKENLQALYSKLYSNELRNHFFPPAFRIPSRTLTSDLKTEQIQAEIKQFAKEQQGFFVKHAYGVSGRFLAKEKEILLNQDKIERYSTWAKQSGILLEKQLQGKDWSVQFTITEEGQIIYEGCLANYLETTAYKGSFIVENMPSFITKIVPFLNRILKRIKEQGYIGAIGFDLLLTEERAYLIEINPRYTMGRLALAWHEKLKKTICLDKQQETQLFLLHTFTCSQEITNVHLKKIINTLASRNIFLLHMLQYKNKCFLSIWIVGKEQEEVANCLSEIEKIVRSIIL